jgi:hypothetical protein
VNDHGLSNAKQSTAWKKSLRDQRVKPFFTIDDIAINYFMS